MTGSSSMSSYWDRWGSWKESSPYEDKINILKYRYTTMRLCRKVVTTTIINLILISTVLAGVRRATGLTLTKLSKSKSKGKKPKRITFFQRYLLVGEAIFDSLCNLIAIYDRATVVDKDKKLKDLIREQNKSDVESSPILDQVSFGAAASIAAADLSALPSVPEFDPPAYSPFDPIPAPAPAPVATPTTYSELTSESGSTPSAPEASLTATYGVASASPADFQPSKSMTKSDLEASSTSSFS